MSERYLAAMAFRSSRTPLRVCGRLAGGHFWPGPRGRSDLMSGKSTLLAALATAGIATGVVVLPASGHDVKPNGTLAFTGKGRSRDQKIVDVRPKGISLGDHFLGAETLRLAGARAGRMEVDCAV